MQAGFLHVIYDKDNLLASRKPGGGTRFLHVWLWSWTAVIPSSRALVLVPHGVGSNKCCCAEQVAAGPQEKSWTP